MKPGDEIVAIEGKPTPYWLERFGRNISSDNAYLEATLLELGFAGEVWTEMGPRENLALTILRDGASRDVRVGTIDRATLNQRMESAEATGFSLDTSSRIAEVLEGGIAYLRPGPFYGVETPDAMWDDTAFSAFIDESFEMFLEADAQALLIDMRQNPGGDNSFSDQMIAWFADETFRFASEFLVRSSPQSQASNQARLDAYAEAAEGVSGLFAQSYEATPYGETFSFEIPFARPRNGARFEGPVFAMIDRYSYSNTTNVAALLQDYGFATILGEETSDLATTYGAMESFTLPHSGLVVGYPKALIIRPSGDMAPRGVVPDIAIEAPLFAQDDVVLERAMEIVRKETDL
ncbi:MAG: S41 family peptidase [Planctomycetota bacterium]